MALLIGLVLLFAGDGATVARDTSWTYDVVSTPDSMGPFRGSGPAFKAPSPIDIPTPHVMRDQRNFFAAYEAIVDLAGNTTLEKRIRGTGKGNDREVRAAIGHWRFKPATLDGKPIRVRIRILVSNNLPN